MFVLVVILLQKFVKVITKIPKFYWIRSISLQSWYLKTERKNHLRYKFVSLFFCLEEETGWRWMICTRSHSQLTGPRPVQHWDQEPTQYKQVGTCVALCFYHQHLWLYPVQKRQATRICNTYINKLLILLNNLAS